jgi:hypothetical protein
MSSTLSSGLVNPELSRSRSILFSSWSPVTPLNFSWLPLFSFARCIGKCVQCDIQKMRGYYYRTCPGPNKSTNRPGISEVFDDLSSIVVSGNDLLFRNDTTCTQETTEQSPIDMSQFESLAWEKIPPNTPSRVAQKKRKKTIEVAIKTAFTSSGSLQPLINALTECEQAHVSSFFALLDIRATNKDEFASFIKTMLRRLDENLSDDAVQVKFITFVHKLLEAPLQKPCPVRVALNHANAHTFFLRMLKSGPSVIPVRRVECCKVITELCSVDTFDYLGVLDALHHVLYVLEINEKEEKKKTVDIRKAIMETMKAILTRASSVLSSTVKDYIHATIQKSSLDIKNELAVMLGFTAKSRPPKRESGVQSDGSGLEKQPKKMKGGEPSMEKKC